MIKATSILFALNVLSLAIILRHMCHYPVSLQVIWPKRKIDIRGLESNVKNEWNLSLDSSWDCLLVVQRGRVLGMGRASMSVEVT